MASSYADRSKLDYYKDIIDQIRNITVHDSIKYRLKNPKMPEATNIGPIQIN